MGGQPWVSDAQVDMEGQQKVAAIDLGKARVGLAVSDELGLMAHPRAPLDGRNHKTLLARLAELTREEGICRYIVGLPLSLAGEQTRASRRAIRFCQQLANSCGVEVEVVDERWSTVEAERRLREGGATAADMKQRIDGAAAAIILQQWLDARRED